MKIRNICIFIIFYLITACSNQLKIKSATADSVIITGPAEQFVAAYHMAEKECGKHTKKAKYVSDESTNLNTLTFNCNAAVEENPETEAQAEEETAATEAAEETEITESETDVDTEEITEDPASE